MKENNQNYYEQIRNNYELLTEIARDYNCAIITATQKLNYNNMSNNKIDNFRGKYAFLSNFYRAKCYLDGWEFPTSEHAYQAAKTLSKQERQQIQNAETPKQAKYLGYKVTQRPYWNEDKVEYMMLIVRSKFRTNPGLIQKLINTGNAELIEGNNWGDRFWGVDGTGHNYLGRILMALREEFKQKM